MLRDFCVIAALALTFPSSDAFGQSGGAPPLSPGLVSWYSFNTPGQPGLDSAGNNHGTPTNVTQVTGLQGQAAKFTSGWIDLPDSPSLNLKGGDFTLSVFINVPAGTNNRNWFTKATLDTHRYGLGGGASVNNGKITFFFDGGPGGGTTSTSAPFDGTWHHVAGIKRGNQAEIWVDGHLEGTGLIQLSSPDTGTFAIGRTGPCCEFFNGLMDEAKIWNRALSATEIASEASVLSQPSGLVSWYSFDSPGQLGLDSVGSNHGTPVSVTQVAGVQGQAAKFTNGWIDLPDSPSLNLKSGDFTLSVFINVPAGTQNRNWFTKAIQGAHRYGLGGGAPVNNGKITFFFDGGPGGGTTSTSAPFDGTWHHVAGIKRGNQAEIWIDGHREGTGVIQLSSPDTGTFAIGRDGPLYEFFNGLMDEAKIWNRALSGSEMASEAAGLPPSGQFTPFQTTFGSPGGTTNPAGSFAEPVNTATGNYYTSHTDLTVPGKGIAFNFTRYYNSSDTYSGPIGVGWTHSYNVFLVESGVTGSVALKRGDGSVVFFSPTGGGNYTSSTAGLFDQIKKNGDDSFTLTHKNQTRLNFLPSGKLASIVDRNSNSQLLTYDTSGKLVSVADSSGRLFVFVYNADNRLASITDSLGRVFEYGFDSTGNLASFKDAVGGVTQYQYDLNHLMVSAVDPRGNTYLQNSYDAQGRVVLQKNARGFATTFAYDAPAPGTTTITDPLGNITQHIHDSNLRLIRVVDAKGGTTNFAYDSNNLRSSISDALGRSYALSYDSNGNLTGVTDPNGKTTSFLYDAKNNLVKITDRLGRISSFTYDIPGNLTSIVDAAGNASAFAYDASGQLLTAKNPRNFTTSFLYDAAGNLAKLTDALSGNVELTYDAVGRLLSLKNQLGKTGSRSYDANNRLLALTDPLGNVTQLTYDANGNLTRITDANGQATQYAYDSTNKLLQVNDAIGGITRYSYDANTDLSSITDANGHVTALAYDSLRRLDTRTDPLGRQNRYGYDALGNILSTIDGKNKTNSFTYDPLNRLVSIALSDGKNVAYTYDAAGNRLSMADWRGTTNYSFDALNRALSVTTPDGKAAGYSYNSVGSRTTLSYPDGKTVQYQYDALNRLAKVTDWANKSTSYSYDVASNLVSLVHPNGANSVYSYDSTNRLVSLVNRSGTKVLSSFTYGMDKVGNRTQMSLASGTAHLYGYDNLYRLTSWTAPSGQVTQYVYDAVGNRRSLISSAGTTQYAYDAADQLLSAGPTGFTYDANGNQIAKTTNGVTTNYAWDALNRLISVTGGNLNSQYQYDGDGNRVLQQAGANVYRYLNDTNTPLPVVLNEAGPDGNIDYLYGLSMISAASSAFQHYYQTDALGSAVNLTDSIGALRANYSYDPWGKLLNPLDPLGNKSKYKFVGEAVDVGTGLIFLRARYYEASTGRLISEDPVPGPVSNSRTTNRYAYALLNPVRLIDPSGLTAIEGLGEQTGFVFAAFDLLDFLGNFRQFRLEILRIDLRYTIDRLAHKGLHAVPYLGDAFEIYGDLKIADQDTKLRSVGASIMLSLLPQLGLIDFFSGGRLKESMVECSALGDCITALEFPSGMNGGSTLRSDPTVGIPLITGSTIGR